MTDYLRIVLENTEPFRIADDSTSQSGQTTTLRYIPGTTLRGLVIHSLAGCPDFPEIKKILFSDKVRFLNAGLYSDGRELLPSLKGFYEDKSIPEGKKKIQNVVIDGSFSEGYKRAYLGRYCYPDEDCIYYYSVDTSSDMKIKIHLQDRDRQSVFRNEAVCAGYQFVGYIAVEEEALKDRIRNIFGGTVVLGNGRSAGLGKCRVLSTEYTDKIPYSEYMEPDGLQGQAYMMLLSNTVMRAGNGELCGLNIPVLEKKLGVSNLAIQYCAASTVDVRGYNSTWGTRIPSAVMYEQGSVFHLTFDGTLTKEAMHALADQGIGVRRNEGFGRILFLRDYEKIQYKLACSYISGRAVPDRTAGLSEEDQKTLQIAARGYYMNLLNRVIETYIVKHPLERSRTSGSQLGVVGSFADGLRFQPEEAVRAIREYLEHAESKTRKMNVQKEKNSSSYLKKSVESILNTPIEELLSVETREKDSVMGISKQELLTPSDLLRIRLKLLSGIIRYENKGEK